MGLTNVAVHVTFANMAHFRTDESWFITTIITDAGLQAPQQNPDAIDAKFLEYYEGLLEFNAKSTNKNQMTSAGMKVPTEERAPGSDKRGLRHDPRRTSERFVEQIMQGSSSLFERLVVDLPVSMAYGGGAEPCSTRRAPLSPQPARPPDLAEPIAPVQDPRHDVRACE